jgi:hypothetical protein
MKVVAATFAACLLACQGSRTYLDEVPCEDPVTISTDFSLVQQEVVELAVARWNEILVTPICTVRGPVDVAHGTRAIAPIATSHPRWQEVQQLWPGAVGAYYPTEGIVLLPDDTSRSDAMGILLHEIGHSAGLKHVEPPGIMAERGNIPEDFTPNDIAECRRVGACR